MTGGTMSRSNNDGTNMAECLLEDSPFEALLSVSAVSESLAMAFANDLSKSMSFNTDRNNKASMKSRRSNSSIISSSSSTLDDMNNNIHKKKNENDSNEKDKKEVRYPIPLPSSLQFTASTKIRHHINATSLENNSNANLNNTTTNNNNNNSSEVISYMNSNTSIDTALVCTESILASLSKIADGGSKASAEMRQLEEQRYTLDKEATDISNALKLREHAQLASSALAAQRYKEAALSIQNYRNVHATSRAMEYAGKSSLRQFARTEEVVQRTILDKYETAVMRGDLNGLSELTPLLGLLHLADKGVALYLRFSRDALYRSMEAKPTIDASVTSDPSESTTNIPTTGPDGKRLTRRQQQELQSQQQKQSQEAENNSTCAKLAKIFNAGVTHLRHHLPMVASALGDADGDAALVQLAHMEVEKRANQILKEYAKEKHMAILEAKASRVTVRIEEKFIHGLGIDMEDDDDDTLTGSSGVVGGSGSTLGYYEENDCGFRASLGSLADLDKIMDETALALQHTESYERFIRHAVDQVLKARELRFIKKRNERKKKEHLQQNNNDVGKKDENNEKKEDTLTELEILPTHTKLNEIVAEIGGYYSGLERVLLLASMQRAFINASNSLDPDPSKYSPMSTLSNENTANHQNALSNTLPQGRNALQTSIVEECLYAAQRSTMRAFATGHSGTACAAANFCSDSLGRVFLEVLIKKAEESTAALKPGEGLLEGNGGLGQAALSVINSGQKRFRNVGAGGAKGEEKKNLDLDSAEMKYKVYMGIAHACAHYNDIEVAAEYIKRLEAQFLTEIDSTFPPGNMTEQLRMCVKSLSPVHESFKNASKRCVEQIVIQILPRVRSIANDAVGQEGTTTASFMGSSVIGGSTSIVSTVKMNYDLDDQAYELSQIGEGYMSKMCSFLDDLLTPLRLQLAPHLSDAVVLGAIGGASKRIESAIRRSRFTALGALSLDADIRYFVNYTKERLDSPEYASSVALFAACNPLARLSQIALLMNVDDLEDVLDLISSSKRKGNWDLKLDDAKSLLNLRDDFEGRKVNELLRVPDGDE